MADQKGNWYASGQAAAAGGAKAPTYSVPKPSYQQQQATNAGFNIGRQAPPPAATSKK